MSESAKTIIKYFCDRFLELEYYPNSLKTILDLPIKTLKNFDKATVKKFNNMEINSIRDFTELKDKDIKTFINKKDISYDLIRNAIVAARLISNAWSKRAEYKKEAKMKVVFAGLDFAGKTSLINRLLNDYNYQDQINLEPTVGVNVEEYNTERLNLILWDLGGQKNHIEEYLEEPEKYFIQLDMLFFIIDSQDDKRYELAIKYLSDILDILEFLNEVPYLMILLNKADSNIINDPDFQIKLEYLIEKISELFIKKQKKWQFEITPTSLYNIYSNEPEIARSIKDFFSSKKAIDKKEIDIDHFVELSDEIEEKLKKILDINLRLMDKVASELSEIKGVLLQLAPSDLSKSLFSVPFESSPGEFLSETRKIAQKAKQLVKESQKKKKKKSRELKEGTKKVKGKPTMGTPQRLKELPKPAEIQPEKDIGKELAKTLSSKKEISAKPRIVSPSAPPSAPPKAAPPTAPPAKASGSSKIANIDNLKPPPPPPKIAPPTPPSRGAIRTQVISELKEMFLKRGIISK